MTHELTAEEIALLKEGGFDPQARSGDDPFYTTAHELAELIQTSLSPDAAAQRLGVPLDDVQRMIQGRVLYAFAGRTGWLIPGFQFEGDHLIPGIETVNAHLADDLPPIVVYRWYTLPDDALEQDGRRWTPLEWLVKQKPEDVIVRSASNLSTYGQDEPESDATPNKPGTLADRFPITDETPPISTDDIEIRCGAPPQRMIEI